MTIWHNSIRVMPLLRYRHYELLDQEAGMLEPVVENRTPTRAWVVVVAGTCVNLCLGILYAWSIWKANLVGSAEHAAGTAMSGRISVFLSVGT